MQCIPSLKNKQGNSKPSVLTKSKVEIMRVKYEIKFLYKKKQQLNPQLYRCHLENAGKWDIYWTHIEKIINQKLEYEVKRNHCIS
jgi:hypothetical protein